MPLFDQKPMKSQPASSNMIYCVLLFSELTLSTYLQLLALLEAKQPNGRHLIPLLVTGFPLDGRNYGHTRTRNTHSCQRAIPADELGHFSLPCLRGIRRLEMELSCGEPTLWIDKS